MNLNQYLKITKYKPSQRLLNPLPSIIHSMFMSTLFISFLIANPTLVMSS